MSRIFLNPVVTVPLGILIYFITFIAVFAMLAEPDARLGAGFSGLVWGLLIFTGGVTLLSFLIALLPLPKVPLNYNIRNLQVRWKTTLVTALAFTLVIGLLTSLLGFVRGMSTMTENSGMPGNVMVLSDGATDEAFSKLPAGVSVQVLPSDIQSLIVKNDKGRYLFSKEMYVVVSHQLPQEDASGAKRRFVQMRGLDDPALAGETHGIELAQGTWPSPSGVRKITRTENGQSFEDTAPEIVLGDGISQLFGKDIGKSSLSVGDTVHMGPRIWYVCGIMKPNGSAFGSEIWALDTHVGKQFGRDTYTSYVARTLNEPTALKAAKLFKEFQTSGALLGTTEMEYYSKLTETNQQFSVAIYIVAVIMAIGGVLGVMNTMFAAISQRKKDIGMMRLIGFTRWQILFSFLLESLVIALIGGLLGMGLGYLTDGLTARSMMSAGQGGGKSIVLRLTVDGGVLLVGFIFTLVMGVIGGLIPSLSAMRLRPLESLR